MYFLLSFLTTHAFLVSVGIMLPYLLSSTGWEWQEHSWHSYSNHSWLYQNTLVNLGIEEESKRDGEDSVRPFNPVKPKGQANWDFPYLHRCTDLNANCIPWKRGLQGWLTRESPAKRRGILVFIVDYATRSKFGRSEELSSPHHVGGELTPQATAQVPLMASSEPSIHFGFANANGRDEKLRWDERFYGGLSRSHRCARGWSPSPQVLPIGAAPDGDIASRPLDLDRKVHIGARYVEIVILLN